jgi:uncharacterized membrane protein
MTAAAHAQDYARPARRRRPWLQPVFAGLSLVILIPILAALTFTVAKGRPLPWQFHVAWVSPHLAVALVVLGMGALQLMLKKGDRRHRMMGYAWLVLMAFISVSGILIQLEPGHVTVIHIASSVTAVINLILLPLVVWGARTGRRRVHRIAAMTMFAFMLNAGLMAFVPFRAIGLLVFGAFH